ncbi:MAG: cysteine desulfurase NifS [Candidatus Hodarchaeota archaeon]
MNVYCDNGATTQVDPKVVEAMLPYFTEYYGNASSLHNFGEQARTAVEQARATIAKAINADPSEIIFTSGGSEADNLAILGTAVAYKGKGNHIITSKIEHPAILQTCEYLAKIGYNVTYLDVNKEGFIDLAQLEKALTEKTILVSIMHANNEIGVIQPLEDIGTLCAENNVFFHTDAVQSFIKTDLDVKKSQLTFASFAAHKIHGPKGVGALYRKQGVKITPLIHGGHQELGLRAGTENVPGIVGFGKAVELGMNPEHMGKMKTLRDQLILGILKTIPNSRLNGPNGNKRLVNNANISYDFVEGESVLLRLNMEGIAVSTGSACSSGSTEPSHVLRAIQVPDKSIHGTIRYTISRFTSQKEINYVIESSAKVVEALRRISPLR